MTRKTSKASTEAAAFYHRSAAAVDVRRVPTGKPTSELRYVKKKGTKYFIYGFDWVFEEILNKINLVQPVIV